MALAVFAGACFALPVSGHADAVAEPSVARDAVSEPSVARDAVGEPNVARARSAGVLGRRGQLSLFGGLGLRAVRTERQGYLPNPTDPRGDAVWDYELLVAPGGWLFVWDRVAVGAALDASYLSRETSTAPYTAWGLGASLAIGIVVPLSADERLAWFPQLWAGSGYTAWHATDYGLENGGRVSRSSADGLYIEGTLRLPMVLSIPPATFLGVGPGLRIRFDEVYPVASLRVSAWVGRYF